MDPDPTPLAGRVVLGVAAAFWAAFVPGQVELMLERRLQWPRLWVVPEGVSGPAGARVELA